MTPDIARALAVEAFALLYDRAVKAHQLAFMHGVTAQSMLNIAITRARREPSFAQDAAVLDASAVVERDQAALTAAEHALDEIELRQDAIIDAIVAVLVEAPAAGLPLYHEIKAEGA